MLIEITSVIILLQNYFKAYAVPSEYCLHSFNSSNCNGAPTPVFYYYKPGSRCEIAIWRGCPTLNKFDDIYICSEYCIFRFRRTPVRESMEFDERPEELGDDKSIQNLNQPKEDEDQEPCEKPVDPEQCQETISLHYTYDKNKTECVPIMWGECPSDNIFQEKRACVETCIDWKNDIKNLTENEIADVDNLLDTVTTDNHVTILKLHLFVTHANTVNTTNVTKRFESTTTMKTTSTSVSTTSVDADTAPTATEVDADTAPTATEVVADTAPTATEVVAAVTAPATEVNALTSVSASSTPVGGMSVTHPVPLTTTKRKYTGKTRRSTGTPVDYAIPT